MTEPEWISISQVAHLFRLVSGRNVTSGWVVSYCRDQGIELTQRTICRETEQVVTGLDRAQFLKILAALDNFLEK